MKYSIGVIYPSRGLCYTETLKEVLDELNSLSDATYEIYWSHGNKLPTCFNKPLARSLRHGSSYICPECAHILQTSTYNDTIDTWKNNANIKDATTIKKCSKATPKNGTRNDIVTNIGARKLAKGEELGLEIESSIRTDMSRLDQQSQENLYSSTDLSWNENSGDHLESTKASTTLTVSGTITDQKTYSYGSEVLDTDREQLTSFVPTAVNRTCNHNNCINNPRTIRPHSHILLLEDDMVIQKGTLKDMLDADEDIISCDYPIVKAPSGTVLYDQDDNAIFTGTGFMLAKKKVFDTMPRPIFRADIEWTFKQSGDKVKFTAKEVDPDKVYGHHDITFGLYQYMNNKPIKVSSHVLAQRKLVKKGDNKNNIGADEIELYDQYRKINYYMIEEEKEVNSNDLLVEIELDGRKIHVTKETANRLAKDQLIEQKVFEAGNLIIDVSECPKALKAFRKVKK